MGRASKADRRTNGADARLEQLCEETERLKFEATAFCLATRFLDLQREIGQLSQEYSHARELERAYSRAGDDKAASTARHAAMATLAKAMSAVSLQLGGLDNDSQVSVFDHAFQIFTHAASGRIHPDILGESDAPCWLNAPERIDVEIIAVAIVSHCNSLNLRTKGELQDLVLAALRRADFYKFKGNLNGKHVQPNRRKYLERRESAIFGRSPATRAELSTARNRQKFDGVLKILKLATGDREKQLNDWLEKLEELARNCPNRQITI